MTNYVLIENHWRKRYTDALVVDMPHVTATITKTLKHIIAAAAIIFMGCQNDYILATEVVEEVAAPATEVVVDSLIQPEEVVQLDVLIVLDTSGSMSDNYEQVSRGVELLRGDIELITIDYQIGFINSSLKETYFVGPFDVYSSSIDFLLAPWLLGNDHLETAFYGTYMFATNTAEGEDFFRESADKLLIFISDEDEQSSLTAQVFHEWIKDYFGLVQRDVVTIVTLETSECENARGLNVGEKFIELSAYYGKTAIDICSDWELALADSSFLTGPKNYIELSQAPIEDSIKVYVDHIETEEWYYLSETNIVYLDFIPSEGQLVEIAYVIYS
tara:strand:+ start:1038 stop:2030 length:993 start_codon:yes stop_codon:yes gene_type:complete